MKRYVIFAAVGPFFGGFWLLLTSTLMSGFLAGAGLNEIGKLLAVFFKTLQYSYLFGVLPALMFGAIDDILFHVKRLAPALRVLLVGCIAFAAAELTYGSRGPDSGVLQFIMYGLVGFIPTTLSSFLAHRYADPQQEAAAA